MRDLGDDLERRTSLRHRLEAPCEVLVAGRSHEAILIDASRDGVFVTSDAPLWPGALVRVRLEAADRYALVLRERHVPVRLRDLVPRGFGLRWVASGSTH
jgi:hypothetical protein